jgi:hypothetical protein
LSSSVDLFHRVVCGDVRFAPGQNDFLRALAGEQTTPLLLRGTAQHHLSCGRKPSAHGQEFTQLAWSDRPFVVLRIDVMVALIMHQTQQRNFGRITSRSFSPFLSSETVSFIVSMAMARQTVNKFWRRAAHVGFNETFEGHGRIVRQVIDFTSKRARCDHLVGREVPEGERMIKKW